MAAVVNGEPSLSPSLPNAKRKRDSTSDKDAHEGDNKSQPEEETRQEGFDETLKCLLQVLTKYDSGLGLLRHPLPVRTISEPDNKRQKLSDEIDTAQTIESRILHDEYRSLQAFVDDVEAAEKSILEEHKHRDAPKDVSRNIASSDAIGDKTKIFKSHLNNLIRRHPFKSGSAECFESHKEENEAESNGLRSIPREDKLMLTVLGNAPRGRQLFSSLQMPTGQPKNSDVADGSTSVAKIDEASLPSGITTSKVIPFNPKDFEEPKRKSRTLGEVFPPRASLPALEPPRKSDSPEARSSVVTWINPVDNAAITANRSTDRRYYSSSFVPMAHWLNYGYRLPARPSRNRRYGGAPESRQGKRPQLPSADEDTLFGGIYSSFAPSIDSCGSVVPYDTKSRAWWGRSGAKQFQRLLSHGRNETEDTRHSPEVILDEDTLKDAVESFVPEPIESANADEKKDDATEKDKDMEDILQEISELLQTLDSYRQLRHLDSTASEVTRAEQSNSDDRVAPSDAEFEIYQTLKSSLSTMIASLPPYALAKLDGEQLAELNISKKVLLDNVDYFGVMEEDDYSLQQRQTPKIPQATGSSQSPSNISRTPPTVSYQRHQGRTRQSSSNFPVPQPYGSRTPSSAPYHVNGSPQHPTPLQPSSQRPSYVQPPQFSRPGSSQYTRAGILQQFQRSAPSGNSPNQAQRGPSPAQHPQQPYQHRPIPPNYTHHTPNNAYHSPAVGGATSPQKPSTYTQSPQQRQYMNAAPNPNQPRYFQQQQQQQQQQQRQPQQPHQQPPQGSPPGSYQNLQSHQGSPAPSHPNPSVAKAYSRSAAEQAALMEHNRVQLMENRRQGSGTPPQAAHDPQPNGQSANQSTTSQ